MKSSLMIKTSQNLSSRIVITIAVLLIVRFGCFVPLTGIHPARWTEMFVQNTTLQLLNLLYGGGLRHGSVLALGIWPFIWQHTVFQVLLLIVPGWQQAYASGDPDERRRVRRVHTLCLLTLTPLLALLMGWLLLRSAQAQGLLTAASIWPGLSVLIVGATAYAPAFMLIDRYGLGRGSRLVMAMSILGEYAYQARQALTGATFANIWLPALVLLVVTALYLAAAYIPQYGVRKIPVQYPERKVGARTYGGQSSHIPVHLMHEGLTPIYAGLELLLLIAALVGVLQSGGICASKSFGNVLLTPVVAYPIYIIFLVVYPLLSRAVKSSPRDLADSMKHYGGYIPGVRPGNKTAVYIDSILTTLARAETLILLGLLTFPGVVFLLTGWHPGLAGLGLFVVGSVAFSIQQRLRAYREREEQRLLETHYTGFMRRNMGNASTGDQKTS